MRNKTLVAAILLILFVLVGGEMLLRRLSLEAPADSLWQGPDSAAIPAGTNGDLIRYGRDLIVRTGYYFGPAGTISHTSNGMNCQNCHLYAGRQPWGNNFGGVRSSYPKFKERRGAVEDIAQRVSDCFERSLNGIAPDTSSREVRAMIAYMEWLGAGVPKGKKPAGSGIQAIPYLTRAADPAKGKQLYVLKCQLCHGPEGAGMKSGDGSVYIYPPLWGDHSYNTGASLYRLSRLAGFMFNNMPSGTDYRKPQLSAEEAWDLSAFIDSQPRPVRTFGADWPDIKLKPVDHPYGPFPDTFGAVQHKFGPFLPIVQEQKKSSK
ncbi:MAG TPA: c-type cytochrome [Puia sp.]|nr:c-type cytochrome [Puia sp.]